MQTYCPLNKEDWRNWLKFNHEIEDSIWLIIRKKNAPNPNLSWSDAVDEALCFGWIDSVKKSIDNETYKQYYSKRKANSTWSKINKEKVAFFIEKNLMSETGLKCIEVAKKNGSWTLLDSVEALIVPDNLEQEFSKHNGSKAYYNTLSKSAQKILLAWVALAKRPETKQKRIIEIAVNASKNLMPKQFR